MITKICFWKVIDHSRIMIDALDVILVKKGFHMLYVNLLMLQNPMWSRIPPSGLEQGLTFVSTKAPK